MDKSKFIDEQLRNLYFANKHYFNDLIAMLEYKDIKIIENNKARFLSDIELGIKTLEELRDNYLEISK